MDSTATSSPSDQHVHAHHHGHGHGHGHVGHGHGQGHGEDAWSGEEYMKRPGVAETAIVSADSVKHALLGADLRESDLKQMDVLEIGCGGGAVTPHLAPLFHHLHAIDTSPSMLLAFSSRPLPNVSQSLHLLHADSAKEFHQPQYSPLLEQQERKVVPPVSQFDVAFANLVVHHVDDLAGFFAGVLGLLKDGGWLVVTEFGKPEGGEDLMGAARAERAKTTSAGSVNAPDHYHATFTRESISSLLSTHGFVSVHAELRGLLPVNGPDKPQPECLIVRGQKPKSS